MNFSLTDDQRSLRDTIRDFAASELNDDLIENDVGGVFPHGKWRKCAAYSASALPSARQRRPAIRSDAGRARRDRGGAARGLIARHTSGGVAVSQRGVN